MINGTHLNLYDSIQAIVPPKVVEQSAERKVEPTKNADNDTERKFKHKGQIIDIYV